MARYRRHTSGVELFAQALGLILMLSVLVPSAGRFVISLGIILFCVLAFVVIVAVLFVARKRRAWSNDQRVQEQTEDCSAPISDPIKPTVFEQTRPLSTDSLIASIRALDWYQFEKIVAAIFRKRGFAVSSRGGANPDGGIDLLVTDQTGEQTAIQCKQWRTWNVGVKAVREFLGALTHAGISKGIIVALRGYTGEAKALAGQHHIRLLNETDLAALLEQVNARNDLEIQKLLNDTRKFCPKCEREMVLRTNRNGKNPGNQFWGCSAYPSCRCTLPAN